MQTRSKQSPYRVGLSWDRVTSVRGLGRERNSRPIYRLVLRLDGKEVEQTSDQERMLQDHLCD